MRQAKVRQEDIARAVGVSVSTVSRVLSGAPGISAATSKKVLQAAASLGTPFTMPELEGTAPQPHRLQRALLFLNPVDQNSGSASIYHFLVTGLQKAARKAGLRIELAMLGEDGEIPQSILGGSETGVLFAGVDPSPTLMKSLANDRHPTVLANGLDPTMTHDQVAPNNFFGGWLAAQHLMEMGHRHILHLGTRRRPTLAARSSGFLSAMKKSDFGELEYHTVEMDNVTERDAHIAMESLLKDGRFPYSAVFCAADPVALAVMQELRMQGIDVPGDVSVLGFNGLPMAELSSPLLSTLSVDWEYLGTEAIRLLVSRSADPDRPTQQTQTQVVLKQAESVAMAKI